MSNNLFSIFAPQASIMYLNWISTVCVMLWLPSLFWLSWSTSTIPWTTLMKGTHSALAPNLTNINSPGHTHWPVSLLMFIMLTNISGMIPYVFTASSHLVFTLSCGLTFWLGYSLYAFTMDLSHSMAHLVPLGTPTLLLPVMVVIELLSSLIRPLTLSVRLAANMVAGHLLLVLSTTPHNWWNISTMMILITAWGLLVVLESAVACIQAYVFSMLSTLYIADFNTTKLNSLK